MNTVFPFQLPLHTLHAFNAVSQPDAWSIRQLQVPELWRQSKGQGIRVAVLDTGIDFKHRDLSNATVAARDFTGSSAGITDQNGHGTHVAGIIGARNAYGQIVGIAPEVQLLVGKVLGKDGGGTLEAMTSGIAWAIEQGADIINISSCSTQHYDRLRKSTEEAEKAGVFVICAAGNNGPAADTIGYPARYDSVIAVGATDSNNAVLSSSARGSALDIAAPGYDICSTWLGNTYASMSGTSMATPFVSGIVALMLAKHRNRPDSATPVSNNKELREHLVKAAFDIDSPGFDPASGYGLINPKGLLQ